MDSLIYIDFYSVKRLLIEPTPLITMFSISIVLIFIYFFLSLIIKKLVTNPSTSKNLRLLIFSFFFSIWGIELILHVAGIKDSYVEKRGQPRSLETNYINKEFMPYQPNTEYSMSSQEFQYKRMTNEYGFSDKSWESSNEGETKIFVLGDSFTEGDGSPYDSTWTYLLNQNFSNNNTPVRFYNAGLRGSDPIYEYVTLKKYFNVIQPDYIIVALHGQDMWQDFMSRGGFERFKNAGKSNISFKEVIYGYSRIARLIMENIIGYNELLYIENDDQKNRITMEIIPDMVKKYSKFSLENQTPILFVYLPHLVDFLDSSYHISYRKSLFQHSDSIGISTINLTNCVKANQKDPSLMFWPQDGHYNSFGNTIIAECLCHELSELLTLKDHSKEN